MNTNISSNESGISANLQEVYLQTKSQWLKNNKTKISTRKRASDSVPYWIILVALCLYLLSAPHTSAVFDLLTPGWGWVAPLAVEFGLLYASFRKRVAASSSEKLIWQLKALETLLFMTAILVNGAGSFISVAHVTNIQNSSFADLFNSFGGLPAITQVGLIMSIFAALIIPLGALTAGEGLAHLILSNSYLPTSNDDERWLTVANQEFYRALFSLYVSQGYSTRDARQLAGNETKAFLAPVLNTGSLPPSGGLSVAPAPLIAPLMASKSNALPIAAPHTDNGATPKADLVATFIKNNPEVLDMSVDSGLKKAVETGINVGRSTYAAALKNARAKLS